MLDQAKKRLSRRDRERERHRQEILQAGERVFVREGYHAATVEAIAREAEFGIGTIYNFFQSKEDLYTRVVEKIAQNFMGNFEEKVLSRADPEEAIAALIELRLTHFEDHRGFFRVFFETVPGSRLDPARAFPDNCAGLYDRYTEAVTEVFRRGISEQVFDETDPFYLALCLDGIINAFVSYWSKREPTEPLAVRVEKMKREFLGRIKRPPRDEQRQPLRRREAGEPAGSL